jgi:hypothetical protein
MLDIYLLIAFGALFAVLAFLNALLKLLLRREKVGFWDTALVFIPTCLVLLALFMNVADLTQVNSMIDLAAKGIGAGLAALGLLVTLLELFRAQRLRASRGLMMLWAGLLIVVSSFTMPLLAQNFQFTPPTPVFVAENGTPVARLAADSTDEATESATAAPTATHTRTSTPTPTVTRTPRPTDTPTPTRERFVYHTRTPEPTPTVANPCLVLVKFNLRLRETPDGESETIEVIPFDTNVTAYGRNDDSTWWYVTFNDQWGWIDGEFAEASSACADLPEQDVE